MFRDTYLNINDKNSYNKINAAYAQGGPEQAVKALNKNLDLAIDDYATFNWAAVAQAINLLGGVDIELSDNEFSFINAFITEVVENTGIPSVQLTHAGLNHLDGVQAVGQLHRRDAGVLHDLSAVSYTHLGHPAGADRRDVYLCVGICKKKA